MGSDRPIKARAAALSRPVAATLEVDFAAECLAAAKHDTILERTVAPALSYRFYFYFTGR